MCQTRVSSTRNATFASGNTLVRVLGGTKNPCGNGDTHSLDFPHQIGVLGYGKTLGHVFGGAKSPCGKHADSHPGFGGGPVSNPVPPGCVVRVPTHWAICAPFRWRVPSKGAPFPTLEPLGVHLFRHGNLRFPTHNGALGVKMGGNESYGRRASF